MAWNGSGDTGRARTPSAPQKKGGASSPAWLKGAFAGLLVVVLALAAYFILGRARPPSAPHKSSTKPAKIAEAMPTKANTNVADKVATTAEPKVRKGGPGGGKPSRFVNGHYVSPDPAYAEMKKRLDEQMAKDPFRYFCDNQIYAIVSAQPGNFLIPVPFDENFMREFKESLKEPIIISKDDPEDIKEMKQAVKDAKIWLCDQMAAGNDIKQILTEARDKINGLCQLQEYYRGEILDMKRSGEKSPEEIQDFVDAANKIIDKYAAEKLDFPHPAINAHVKFIKSPREAMAEAEGKNQ